MIINKNKLNTILKKSNYSIKIDKEILKTGDNWEVNIKGTIKGITMSSKMPEWFKIWNEKEFMPLKKDVIELKKDVSKLKKDVIEIKKDVIELKKDVSKLKKDVIEIKKDIINIKKDIVIMKKDIVNIKKDIVAMKNTPTMKKELANL